MRRSLASSLPSTLAAVTCLLICVAIPRNLHAQAMNFTIDGVQRQALVLVPANASRSTERLPLIFAFHGHGGNMVQTAAQMRFDKAWPEAIVVYMQGLPTNTDGDPYGYEPGWQHEPGEFADRDLKFFDMVLAALRKAFPVDDNRVYATGFSNGGIFTYLLWGTRGNTFAALAPVAARKFPAVHLTVPIPLLHIAGEKDENIPIQQQLEAMAAARQVNGTGAGHSCGEYCTEYAAAPRKGVGDSSHSAPVVAFIHPFGHVYPRYASDMIVEFFKKYSRAQMQTPRLGDNTYR